MLPTTYTVEELEPVLKLKAAAIQRLIRKGTLPGRKIGKQFVVMEQNVRLFLEQQDKRRSY
jgi:excisionase family DNA binding protein